ncbi:glycoside hydrolase family 15 protein [Corynebacterium caspium]|uniref:glycoside hydrolase family 15 protein n=1 Tax=Corynebacterium caspium TaxID=234828 RepID=UPI00036056EB|nr:glycoside hydrolase family 15 protein [Corynebacterium caspium]WKD60023.1 Trehalase [Corynebacterium caspium DSM 44850]
MTQFRPLEDYALLSNRCGSALVCRDGSIDWLCLPRFDSPAIFSAILGTPEHGRWKLSVRDGEIINWRYLPGTLVLETTWQGPDGKAVITDLMAPPHTYAELLRSAHCLEGSVIIENDFRPTADYGRWPIQPSEDGTLFISGDFSSTLQLSATETHIWTLSTHFPNVTGPGSEQLAEFSDTPDISTAQRAAQDMWSAPGQDHIEGISLLVLEALSHAELGSMVAAPTASLPELFGGGRNWDYRYTWLRDSALTIEVLVRHGYHDAATAWVKWLKNTLDELPENMLIMYGLGGEKELHERVIEYLPGYENSRPVRIGNGAFDQYQADVAGEVMLALGEIRRAGILPDSTTWDLQCKIADFVIRNYDRRDHGIWEMRGELHFFTHGRVMMWAALNEAVLTARECGFAGDVARWEEYRDRLRAEIMERGVDKLTGSFIQAYGVDEVDSSLLQIPITGFCAPDDPHMLATVERIENELMSPEGYLYRYRTAAGLDGLEGEEYPFLICSFWLVEQYARTPGRLEDARTLFRRLNAVTSELGLLAEEYDPETQRLAGNFPQAFSHLGLVRAADAIRAASLRT